MCRVIESLDEAREFVLCMFRDERLLEIYRWGDRNSWGQTKHGIEHAFAVQELAVQLARKVNERYPGRIDEVTMIVIMAAAFLHDVGRGHCTDPNKLDDHDTVGARWCNEFLRDCKNFKGCRILPDQIIERIVRVVQCHRASRFNTMKGTDPALDIVVLADKCIGDEMRVRAGRRAALELCRWFGVPWLREYLEDAKARYPKLLRRLPINKGCIHDRINFAIKEANLDVDASSEDLVLKLQLKSGVLTPDLIYGNSYYSAAYWACSRAAKHLGFSFRLEFNGVKYVYDDDGNPPGWKPVTSISIQRGVGA